VTDAETIIDLSAPRHYEQVTPHGRRRRRAAIVALAAAAAVITGGAGYAAVQRATESPAVVPGVASSPASDAGPGAASGAGPGAAAGPGVRSSRGAAPVKASPAGLHVPPG
jgi:hypothetical protein